MNDTEKELRRIRLEDLDTSLQNRIYNMVQNDDEGWNKIKDIINTTYEKTTIEEKVVTVTITNKDPDKQTVQVIVNDNTYTADSFTCYSTSSYRIIITPLAFLQAGECNVALTGYFRDDTNIVVGKTSSIIADKDEEDTSPTYTIKVKIGSRYLNNESYATLGLNETYIWNPSDIKNKVGECDPDNIIDIFWVRKYSSSYGSYYAFYGGKSVAGLFNTFTSYMITPDGTRYTIAENIPNSSFNSTGDLNNLPSLTTETMYNLFYSLVGEWVTIEIYLT